MISTSKPFIHLVETDPDYADVAKEWLEREFQYTVLVDPGAIHAMSTAYEKITGKTIFIIAHDASDVGGVRLVKAFRERFRYPAYFIVLIPRDDHKMAAEVLRHDAEPFSKEPPEGGPPYNLGEYFKERILFGEREMNKQSIDQLTGAYLRGQALEMWKKDFLNAKKKRKSTAFIYLDLNYFAAINKAVGEPEGDEYLRKFGKCLLDVADSDDIVCRQGGDEFLLILPESEQLTASARAERFVTLLRKEVSAVMVNALGMKMPLSFSAGCHVMQARYLGNDPHDALKKASKNANDQMGQHKRKMHSEIMRGPFGPTVRKLLEELKKQKEGL